MENDRLIIREVVPEDREAFHVFFDTMGEESKAFFNSTGGNSRIVEEYLDGKKPRYKMWAGRQMQFGKSARSFTSK